MICGLLGVAAGGCVDTAPVRAGPAAGPIGRASIASVSVDVTPLKARGLGPYADTVAAALRSALDEAFADRMGRGGARLVVRIDAISMRDYVGSGSRRGFGGSQTDYLEGEALLIGERGEVLRRLPQLSALPASSGGAWYLPDNEERRVRALAAHFAGWLRRQLE